MLPKFADNRDSRSWASRLRHRRIALFERLISSLPDPVRVLDVGGRAEFWQLYRQGGGRRIELTLLNLDERHPSGEHECVVGDARDLSMFEDNRFDACFSNSLIEHVGTFHDQELAAAEIRRVARVYFVQTPNRGFPLEPHFVLPGFQYLPLALRSALHQRFALGWMQRQPDPILARADVEQIRLLSCAEMRRLFPDGHILREQIGPFVKSWVAARASGLDVAWPADGRI